MNQVLSLQDLPADLQQSFKEHDPMSWINTLGKTEIPNVFINIPQELIAKNKQTMLIVIGPSGAGKDTVIDPLIAQGLLVQAVSATTRKRRIEENEPETRQVWMRAQNENETHEEYLSNLVIEYGLLEFDEHQGNFYGLPKSSLEKIPKEKTIVVRTENKGLTTIKNKLQAEYNIISIFITAESYEALFERIKSRNDIELRMRKAVEEIIEAKSQINYVLLNANDPKDPEIAIQNAQKSMKMLLEKVINS